MQRLITITIAVVYVINKNMPQKVIHFRKIPTVTIYIIKIYYNTVFNSRPLTNQSSHHSTYCSFFAPYLKIKPYKNIHRVFNLLCTFMPLYLHPHLCTKIQYKLLLILHVTDFLFKGETLSVMSSLSFQRQIFMRHSSRLSHYIFHTNMVLFTLLVVHFIHLF